MVLPLESYVAEQYGRSGVGVKKLRKFQIAKRGWGSGNARTNLEIVRPKFGDLAGVELSPMNS